MPADAAAASSAHQGQRALVDGGPAEHQKAEQRARQLPDQPQARALVRSLARLHDLHVQPRVRALFPLLRDPGQHARLPDLQAGLEDRLQRLARAAQAAPYMAGPQSSLADCGFAVTVPPARRPMQALDRPLVLADKLRAWEQAMAGDGAVQAALAPWRAATEDWLASVRSPG